MELVFFYSEGYNFVNRKVCFAFAQMIPEVDPLFYLDSLYKDGKAPKIKLESRTIHKAIQHGYINILEYNKRLVPKEICSWVAEDGNLALLQWARHNFYSWNEKTCSLAAQGGHLEVLRWLRENGCPWDEETCSNAAMKGHLETLQWAQEQGFFCGVDVCYGAAEGGHLEILQWARANGCP